MSNTGLTLAYLLQLHKLVSICAHQLLGQPQAGCLLWFKAQLQRLGIMLLPAAFMLPLAMLSSAA
jgi:hypothetical protein